MIIKGSRNVRSYCTETESVKHVQKLEHAEISIVMWTCNDTETDGPASLVLRNISEIKLINKVMRTGRVHWFGQVERKDAIDWLTQFHTFMEKIKCQ